jgi:predicted ester cyclase
MKPLIFLFGSLFLLAMSCHRQEQKKLSAMTNPSPDSLRTYIKNYISDVWSKQNFDLARQKYWHPGVFNANAPEIPHGADGMMEQVNAFLAGFPDADIEYEDAIVEGNVIAARIWLTGTHTGEFMGIKPTGKSIRIREYVFLEMKDGKLWKYHPLVDFATLMEQIKADTN